VCCVLCVVGCGLCAVDCGLWVVDLEVKSLGLGWRSVEGAGFMV